MIIEWWIDLPELTSIRLGQHAFCFDDEDDDSSELIMRSGDDEMEWWIDLPKLASLTTEGEDSLSFCNPCIITLEGISYHSVLTSRHALSHHCHPWQELCILLQENHSYKEYLFFLSFISRHHFRSWMRSQRSKDWWLSSSLPPIPYWPSPSPSWASYSSSSLWVLTAMILFYCFLSIARSATIQIWLPSCERYRLFPQFHRKIGSWESRDVDESD